MSAAATRARAAAALLLAAAPAGCATTRAALRPPVDAPLPLTVGVCPGPFGDYGGEGRDLLRAVAERHLFRAVVPLRVGAAPAAPVDLVLVPHVEAPEPRRALGLVTIVPWVASATIFPWLVQSANTVHVRVHPGSEGTAACGALPTRAALVLRDGPRRQTTAMIGWTAPLLPLLPGWERGTVTEFRPAVDQLVAERARLAELARPAPPGR